MGIERQVVTKRITQNRNQTIAYRFDYSALAVGDWFDLVGRSRQRAFAGSRRVNPQAQAMGLETEMITERTMRVTRIS